jgi:hypothetical protein
MADRGAVLRVLVLVTAAIAGCGTDDHDAGAQKAIDAALDRAITTPARGQGEQAFGAALAQIRAHPKEGRAALADRAAGLFSAFNQAENPVALKLLLDAHPPPVIAAKLPRAITSASNNITTFTTRGLAGGADRSVAEVEEDIDRATADMKAHGVVPGTAEFNKEQGALRRAAIKNLRIMAEQHEISGAAFLRELNRVRQIPTS